MSFSYVKRIRSNAKGAFDVELGPKTIVIGENGSGKTRLVSAIELALTGKAPVYEIADKTASQSIELMRLHNGGDDLFAIADIEGVGRAAAAEWRAAGTLESASKPKHRAATCVGDNPMPLRGLRSILSGAQDGMRELFMRAIDASVDDDDIHARLTSAEAHACYSSHRNDDSPLVCLQHAIEGVDATKRQAASAARQLEASAPPIGNIPTEQELADANAREEEATSAYRNAVKAVGAAEAAIAKPSHAHTPGMSPAKAALITVIKTLVEVDRSVCPVCGEHVTKEALLNELRSLTATKSDTPKMPIVTRDTTAFSAAQKAEQVAMAKLTDARNTHLALQQNKQAYADYQHAREQLVKAQRDNALWKSVETELTAARDALLSHGAVDLEKRVQKFLPEAYHFRLILSQGDRRVCYYGFERDGRVDLALSGGESAIVQVALALALHADDSLCVVVPTDCSMSAKTLAEFMLAVNNAEAQIIITTTTQPLGIPAGWKVVRT